MPNPEQMELDIFEDASPTTVVPGIDEILKEEIVSETPTITKCKGADKYVGKRRPQCNGGNPCETCKAKYAAYKHKGVSDPQERLKSPKSVTSLDNIIAPSESLPIGPIELGPLPKEDCYSKSSISKKKFHKSGITEKQIITNGIFINKSGGFLGFTPKDIQSKLILDELIEREVVPDMCKASWYGVKLEGDPSWKKGKIPIFECLENGVLNHPKIKALQILGAEIHVAKDLTNYLKKAQRRLKVEIAAFPRHETVSSVPLFDRCVQGMVLRCIKTFDVSTVNTILKFEKGKRYAVTKVGEDGEETVTLNALSIEPGSEIKTDSSQSYTWGEFDEDFEKHFSDSDIEDKYPTILELYPERIKEATAKLEKFGIEVFDHIKVDAPQIALKRGSLNAYPMRMGKTYADIAATEIRGTQKNAVICPNNARAVWRKELIKWGFKENVDFKAIKSFVDLESPAKYHLITQNWLRDTKDPAADKRGTETCFLAPAYTSKKVKQSYGSSTTVYESRKNHCPKCNADLWRYGKKVYIPGQVPDEGAEKNEWTTTRGYRCRTKDCGYVNYELAAHANCEDIPVKGRLCKTCGIADGTWVPGRYKRVSRKYTSITVDEIHNAKGEDSQTRQAVFNMRAKVRKGLSGTPIANSAMDTYFVLRWLMNAPGATFPYVSDGGRTQFKERFCEMLTIEKSIGQYTDDDGKVVEIKKTSKKLVPFLKNPPDFWKFTAGKILRRNYADKAYLDSLKAAGKYQPEPFPKLHKVRMVPAQAKLMLDSIVNFKAAVEKMKKDAESKGQSLNMAMIQNMAQLVTLKILATCPEHLNDKLGQKVYTGVAGGGKMTAIKQHVSEAMKDGKKVVILSDFHAMQHAVAEALKDQGVIRLKTAWNEDKRAESIEEFQTLGKYKIFIAGTRTIREAVDLSAADVCICCDLLWSPPFQSQAWSRILTPNTRERECKIIILASEGTVDEHIFTTFYSKLVGSEQALDHKVLGRRAMQINVSEFLDRILQTERFLRQFLFEEEVTTMPRVRAKLALGEV